MSTTPLPRHLTQADIKKLRYQSRMGYIIPFMFWVISIALVLLFGSEQTGEVIASGTPLIVYAMLGFGILAIFISFLMNRKYWADIRNNRKKYTIKTVQWKEAKKDYEAGSGSLYIGQKMNAFMAYYLIIDNTRYRVEKPFFDDIKKGDTVYFEYAPVSGFRLNILKAD